MIRQVIKTSSDSFHRRRYVFTCYIVLVLIWSAGGMLIWTGDLKETFSNLGRTWGIVLLGHFGFLTWPAHQASLCLAGKGWGANMLSPISFSTLAAFVLWCGILWAPLLMLRRRKTPVWFCAATQILLALLTFALFWRFGNA